MYLDPDEGSILGAHALDCRWMSSQNPVPDLYWGFYFLDPLGGCTNWSSSETLHRPEEHKFRLCRRITVTVVDGET